MINAAEELWDDNPKFEELKEWFDKVAYAKVEFESYPVEKFANASLHSNHSEKDDKEFFDTLKSINYNNGYGIQQLYGFIVFKDSTWLSRSEYDGAEWWEHNKCPTEEEVFFNFEA